MTNFLTILVFRVHGVHRVHSQRGQVLMIESKQRNAITGERGVIT